MTLAKAETLVAETIKGDAPTMLLIAGGLWADEIPETLDVLLTPAVAYERGSSQDEYTLDDALAASKVTITVTAWAATRTIANQIADAVRELLRQQAIAQTERQSVFNETSREYGVVMQFEVWET